MESNHRHTDFQSAALPTELSSHILVSPVGIEPTSSDFQSSALPTELPNQNLFSRDDKNRTYTKGVKVPCATTTPHPN